eukprot:CAMPEP_0114564040 /NCGR_PEP_ID=MMETSP0114-20121206/13471_1 /TAXON_ID=31324 /ORGANISM="Goniomonas sp, Strain m" /LENGTH=52 /DNA_ID=CAMNT_0001750007 /DNA_START=14 /DNA_END=172 /DNA_ORIENTATION=+
MLRTQLSSSFHVNRAFAATESKKDRAILALKRKLKTDAHIVSALDSPWNSDV